MPLFNPSGGLRVVTGSYVGDGTTNKDVSHSLGKVPQLVIIFDPGYKYVFLLSTADNGYIYGVLGASLNFSRYAVNQMNSTKFSVGNSANPDQSANTQYTTYKWIALG